ncbi:hypothetical protein [Pelistega ratti]
MSFIFFIYKLKLFIS